MNPTLQSQYVYTRVSPRPNNLKATDLPGHRMGHTVRRDILAPASTAKSFKPFCMCGAKADEWFTSKNMAERRWFDPHMVQAEKQLRLPV